MHATGMKATSQREQSVLLLFPKTLKGGSQTGLYGMGASLCKDVVQRPVDAESLGQHHVVTFQKEIFIRNKSHKVITRSQLGPKKPEFRGRRAAGAN